MRMQCSHYGVKTYQYDGSKFSMYLAEVVYASEICSMTSALSQEILERVLHGKWAKLSSKHL